MKKSRFIGYDPEFFLQDDEGNVVSSVGIVGGTKDNPRSINSICSVHEDNVAMELSIVASDNEDDFTKNLIEAIKTAEKEVNLKVINKCSHRFSAEDLDNDTAREAGCGADINALTMEENPRADYTSTDLRCCGGHIHIDLPEEHVNNPIYEQNVILWMDIMLGVPSVILDTDTDRRSIYGKASCFRRTKYGVEYRTLSNFWCFDEKLIRYVFKTTNKAVDLGLTTEVDSEVVNEAIDIINSHDVSRAKVFCEKHKIDY